MVRPGKGANPTRDDDTCTIVIDRRSAENLYYSLALALGGLSAGYDYGFGKKGKGKGSRPNNKGTPTYLPKAAAPAKGKQRTSVTSSPKGRPAAVTLAPKGVRATLTTPIKAVQSVKGTASGTGKKPTLKTASTKSQTKSKTSNKDSKQAKPKLKKKK